MHWLRPPRNPDWQKLAQIHSYCSRGKANLTCERKVKVKVAQLYPTLCDPMDYTVHGILQARILEWVAYIQCTYTEIKKHSDIREMSHV